MAFTLEARGIRKSFAGVEVLHGVDLDATGGSVLALLGENGAGKSTMVKILAGDYTSDGGTITIDGTEHAALTPITARRLGIRMIFQEFQDAPALSVAENISLGRLPGGRGIVSWREVRRRARRILDEMEVDIDPSVPVGTLRVGDRQIVEIARALSDEARLLILDEPTAALSQQEVDVLFGWVRRLRDRGVALIYITHRLDEVTALADRVHVLRDGDTALVDEVANTDRRRMVEAMIGRRMADIGRPAPTGVEPDPNPAIAIRGGSLAGAFADVDLTVRRGEVVCLYGKLGSGTAEVADVCYGLETLTAGTLEIDGAEASPKGPASAINLGVGYLPADRKGEGALMVRPVAENVAIASWRSLAQGGLFINAGTEARAYKRWHERLGVRSRNDPQQLIATLSGGNQQKVLIARWLERASRVLVLVEPTRGVDVGARAEIYGSLRELAAEGTAILAVTSDYEEAVQLADRTLVMARGRVVAELQGDEITTNRLLEAAGG